MQTVVCRTNNRLGHNDLNKFNRCDTRLTVVCKMKGCRVFRDFRLYISLLRFNKGITMIIKSFDDLDIILCPMDIFGRGFPIYHFENRAKEAPEIILGDLTYKNFYIFSRYEDFTDPVVKAYMKYFATRNVDSNETETINKQVSFFKTDTLTRNKYMTLEYELHEREEKVREEEAVKALEEKKAMAKGFRDDGVPLDIISKRTGFTIEEIKAL